MKDLILVTIGLAAFLGILFYILHRDKVFSLFTVIFAASAAIPLLFHLKYDFGWAWLIWIIVIVAIIFYLGKRYPEKMKEVDRYFGRKK